MLRKLKTEIRKKANPSKAKVFQSFFKTAPGEYGEGDIFIGIDVPTSRKIAKEFEDLKLRDIKKLISSKTHEDRFIALLILILQYKKGSEVDKEQIYKFYLNNTSYINNWDLVDVSAHHIVGEHLYEKDKKILFKLAKSKNLWEKRISIVATLWFIRKNRFTETLKISEILLNDNHDLIHKATGWMLREVGKKNLKAEESFLKKHSKKMPRTMLRYAIERLPELKRKSYMKK